MKGDFWEVRPAGIAWITRIGMHFCPIILMLGHADVEGDRARILRFFHARVDGVYSFKILALERGVFWADRIDTLAGLAVNPEMARVGRIETAAIHLPQMDHSRANLGDPVVPLQQDRVVRLNILMRIHAHVVGFRAPVMTVFSRARADLACPINLIALDLGLFLTNRKELHVALADMQEIVRLDRVRVVVAQVPDTIRADQTLAGGSAVPLTQDWAPRIEGQIPGRQALPHLGEFFRQYLEELPEVPLEDITQLAQSIKLRRLSDDDRELLYTTYGKFSLAIRQQITEHCLLPNLSFSNELTVTLTLKYMWELDPQSRETAIRTLRSSGSSDSWIARICKYFFVNFIDQVPRNLRASAAELLGFLIGKLARAYTVRGPNRGDVDSVLRACQEVTDVLVARTAPASIFSSFAFGVLHSTDVYRNSSQHCNAICEILMSGALLIQDQNEELSRLVQTIVDIQQARASRSKLEGQHTK